MHAVSGRSAAPPLRTTDLLILVVLIDGPGHGYAIAQEIGRRSRGQVTIRPGDLYRVLYRMDRAGLIEPAPEPAGAAARMIAVSNTGSPRSAGASPGPRRR